MNIELPFSPGRQIDSFSERGTGGGGRVEVFFFSLLKTDFLFLSALFLEVHEVDVSLP